MTELQNHRSLIDTLRALVASNALPETVQATGARLLSRLQTDIRVLVAGPAASGRQVLAQSLKAKALPRTRIAVAATLEEFHGADADICLWCTRAFQSDEAAFWGDVPDRLKDHSFLVPIHDAKAGRTDAATVSFLEAVAEADFYGLFPLTLAARSADLSTGATEDAQIAALMREVEVMVQWGLAADADNAHVFVEIYGDPLQYEMPAIAYVASPQSVAPTAPPPETASAAQPKDGAGAYALALAALTTGLDPLRDCALDLDRVGRFDTVISLCADASERVAEALRASNDRSPEFAAFCTEVEAATDRILLLSMERGLEPAVSAVTTLLQVRRALEFENAA